MPFWCERLALVHGEKRGNASPRPSERDRRIWRDMQQQLHDVLSQERTCVESMEYLVDARRAR